METVYIETYGCTANKNNSEIIAGLLRQAGFSLTSNIDLADIIIINTCIVKKKTISKIKRRIQDLEKTRKILIITGCMPETHLKELEKNLKNSYNKTFFIGTHHFKDITRLIHTIKEGKIDRKNQKFFLEPRNEEKILLPKISKNKLISIIQISEGCLGECTYCLTKTAKGNLFSYSEEKILKQITSDLNQGAKEIWLTSQDNASYGLDKQGNSQLPELLNKIIKLKHNFKIRLGMMNPDNVLPILDQLLSLYNSNKLYKFLHIPIQSASNRLLKQMNRKYTIEQAEVIIQEFRKIFPDFTLATDIIIGYPTETEQDFKASCDFIKKYKPDVLNIAKFSSHKNTQAHRLKELPINIIKKRTSEIMKLHRQTAYENKKKFLGKEIEVFVNEKKQGIYEARDKNYNIVLLNPKDKEKILGKNLKTKITSLGVHHMIGEIANPIK